MVEISEGALQFQFGEGLSAIKFDTSSWHRQQMRSSLKAMDILAISPVPGAKAKAQHAHWWIEVKDCLGDEEASRPRMAATELDEVTSTRAWVKDQGWTEKVTVGRRKPYIIDELIAKLRDTLASVSVAAREANPDLAFFVAAPGQKLALVLVLCWRQEDFKRLARLLQTKLERALAPYGMQGFIVDEHEPVPGLPWVIKRT